MGDLDGDGKDDLLLRDDREIAIVLAGAHDDGTECVIEFDLPQVTSLGFAIGDLDGDGRSTGAPSPRVTSAEVPQVAQWLRARPIGGPPAVNALSLRLESLSFFVHRRWSTPCSV